MERDKKGRFVKGHKCFKGSEKGWFKKGDNSWNKGKKTGLVPRSAFKKGSKGFTGKHTKKAKEKMRNAKLGKYCGPKSHSWQGGISFEPYDKSFNNKFKRAIRKRDNYICMKCGKHQEKEKKSLCVHHINYDKKLTIPQNCCAICSKCNKEVNFNRKHWIKFFQSLLSEKYGYQYSENNKIILEVEPCHLLL